MTEQKDETPEAGAAEKDAPVRTTEHVTVQRDQAATQIENLLTTANEAAGAARNAWLGFILVMAYLLVTITSTGHRDLLLNNPVTLPIVDVKLPLTSFYVYAPLLFWLLHLGLFIQHAVTAKKLNALKRALAALRGKRPSDYESGIRGRLHHYSFAQYLAGAYGHDVQTENEAERTSAIHRVLMRLILWTSFVILPGLTFLYFQIGFLPYHDVGITWWQRILLIADVALLWAFWPIFRYDKPRWWDCFWSYPLPWMVAKIAATVAIVFLSLCVATLPDETTDQWMASLWPAERQDDRQVFWLTDWLFEGEVGDATLKPDSLFSRNLVVVLEDLVDDDRKLDEHEVSLSLRGRDLRYSFLTASDMHRADLAYAELQGANLQDSNLQGADLNKASLRRTSLDDARLEGAKLRFADLRGAFLSGANALVANFEYAQLQDAELGAADLRGAKLSNALLQGANLHKTNLQGADLAYARLQGANLQKAILRGADLRRAHLQGADLKDAKLEGVDLRDAHLEGADLRAANLKGADLREASAWLAVFPGQTELFNLADLRGMYTLALSEADRMELWKSVENDVEEDDVRGRIIRRLDPILASPLPDWPDSKKWDGIIASQKAPPAQELAATLANLACSDTDGYAAKGVVRRILETTDKAEAMPPIFVMMLLQEPVERCAGRNHLSPETMRRLQTLGAESNGGSDGQ